MTATAKQAAVRALWSGAKDLAGAFVAVVAFGIGFGVAAVGTGMSPTAAIAMSAFVFAGASQYAVLDLWQSPLPLLSLALVTLAANGRHVVYGVTLHDYLAPYRPAPRYAALAVLSDANWAATRQAIQRGECNLGYLVGGGLILWVAWVVGTAIGAIAGNSLGDASRFGVDAIMPAFFVSVLIGMARVRGDWLPWVLAGIAVAALSTVLSTQWAVIVAALVGATFGTLRDARR